MLRTQLLVFIVGGSTAISGYAEEAVAPKQAATMLAYADVLQWLLALLVVLALFGCFIWLLRKSGGLSLAGKQQLSILSGLSLGMREKLVLVKVGEKQLLLGVTPGRIDKLLELEGESRLFQNQDSAIDGGLFAEKLKEILQGKSNA